MKTAGPSLINNGVMSIGACVMDAKTREITESFSVFVSKKRGQKEVAEFMSKSWSGNEDALNSLRHGIKFIGVTERIATKKLYDWLKSLKKYTEGGNTATICYDNGELSLINALFDKADYPPLEWIFGKYNHVTDVESFHNGMANHYPFLNVDNVFLSDRHIIDDNGEDGELVINSNPFMHEKS